MSLNLKNKSILVIEDYAVMRKAIKDMVYTLGAQYVFEAENGVAAISSMNKRQFDIVICDYDLGEGKNGQQILEEARHEKLISFNTLFIIVTAHQTTSFVLSTIEYKPDEYLAKPFNPKQLIRRLEKSAARKKYLSVIEKEIDKGNHARAISHCDKLLKNNNEASRSQLLKIRAELAINTGDFNKASSIYQEILNQRDLSWARLGTGIVAFFQNDYEKAITILQELIVSNPMLMECYDWLAKSYQASDQMSEAEETLLKATEISPQSLSRQKDLARLAERTGNLDTAEKAYKAATQLGKYSIHKSTGDFSGLAKVYSKKNEKIEALKTLIDMRERFIDNPEAELTAATIETEVYHDMGNSKQSEHAFQKVQQLKNQLNDQTTKALQLDIARACYINNDAETADEIITSLILNHIDEDDFIDDIRRMHRDIGKDNHSEILIQKTKKKLLQINNQGVELFKQGKVKEALAIFEKAVEKMPKNKTIILNMAKIILHDLKTSGINEENLLQAHLYIKTAKQLGVASDKLGNLQLQFEKITHSHPSIP